MTIGLDEYQSRPRQGLLWMFALPFRRESGRNARGADTMDGGD